jgi:protein-tyrosine phosphatase
VLHRMGLQTIIDLRNDAEIALHPSSFSGHPAVRYHHVPVDIQAETALDAPERLRNLDLRAHYVELVRDSAGTFAHLFHLLGEAEAYPLAVHCTWGRDRTGVAAALILSAAGVDPDIIVEDYLLSAECLVGSVGRLREQLRQQGYDAEPILANLELRPEHLAGVFAYLSAQGGAEAYLLGLGVTEAELAAFRRQFIAA